MLRRPHLLLLILVLAGCAPGPEPLSVQVPGIGDPRSPSGYAGFIHVRRHYREFRHKRRHHHRPYRYSVTPRFPT